MMAHGAEQSMTTSVSLGISERVVFRDGLMRAMTVWPRPSESPSMSVLSQP